MWRASLAERRQAQVLNAGEVLEGPVRVGAEGLAGQLAEGHGARQGKAGA